MTPAAPEGLAGVHRTLDALREQDRLTLRKASRRRLEEPLEEGLEPRDDAHRPILARVGGDPGRPDDRGTNGVHGTNAPVGTSVVASVYSGP